MCQNLCLCEPTLYLPWLVIPGKIAVQNKAAVSLPKVLVSLANLKQAAHREMAKVDDNRHSTRVPA